MKPVYQTIFHTSVDGPPGDCFRACIACLLELDVAVVPHFVSNPSRWMRDTQEWLATRGFALVWSNQVNSAYWFGCGPLYGIMSGVSPRGDYGHSVVGQLVTVGDGIVWKIAFDPHPSGVGLDGEAKKIGLLVPLDPASCSSPT